MREREEEEEDITHSHSHTHSPLIYSAEVTTEELGGADTHTKKSGVAHLAFANDVDALASLRNFFDYLPLSNKHAPPVRFSEDPVSRKVHALNAFVPPDNNVPYNMKDIITKVKWGKGRGRERIGEREREREREMMILFMFDTHLIFLAKFDFFLNPSSPSLSLPFSLPLPPTHPGL